MKTIRTLIIFFVIVPALFLVNLQAGNGNNGDKKEIRKTFEGIDAVKFRTMSGNCVIKKAEGSKVMVHLVYETDSDFFKPHVEKDGNTLQVKDKLGSGGEDSVWTISVPAKTAVEFTSVSGDFSVEGITADIEARTVSGDIKAVDCTGKIYLNTTSGEFTLENLNGLIDLKGMSSDMKISKLTGEIDVKTTSGDIEIEKLEGKFSLKMASGDIEMKGVKGEFKIQSASGDIDMSDVTITGPSTVKVASGDIEIILANSPAHELTLASASGDTVIDYNGNPVNGWFEFRARAGHGRIVSPFAFDKEETEEKWGQKYDVKSFKRGGDSPRIYLHTTSGTAELKK